MHDRLAAQGLPGEDGEQRPEQPVSGKNLLGTLMPGMREHERANAGQHVHTGGDRASYPQLPVRARS